MQSSAIITNQLIDSTVTAITSKFAIGQLESKAYTDVYDEDDLAIQVPLSFGEDTAWGSSFDIVNKLDETYTSNSTSDVTITVDLQLTFDAFAGAAAYNTSKIVELSIGIQDVDLEESDIVKKYFIAKRGKFVGDGDTGSISFTEANDGFDDLLTKTFNFSATFDLSLYPMDFYIFVKSPMTFTVESGRVVLSQIQSLTPIIIT